MPSSSIAMETENHFQESLDNYYTIFSLKLLKPSHFVSHSKGNNFGHCTESAGVKDIARLKTSILFVLRWTYQHRLVLFSTSRSLSDNTPQQRRHFSSESFGHF
eukprot:TRINITY_DN22188_c1_g1_i1.p1 TRINITY_DN22188_c1_g1~~TRINITY_DN22188_c1_g1_i1.p1  ORF type:complete len:104 (+),score=3.12 TRINITY_DN22188_c1_g1_i1:89-400(+)